MTLPSELGTMRTMSLMIQAARVAEFAHRGQLRKYTGRPYIEHPGRVAARMMRHCAADEYIVAAAWLHDVLEDTSVSEEDLAVFMPGLSMRYVKMLTNPSKQTPHLNRAQRKELDREHLRTCPGDVRRIKMADRIDNLLDLMHPTADIAFVETYLRESDLLLSSLLIPHDDLTAEYRDTLATVGRWTRERRALLDASA